MKRNDAKQTRIQHTYVEKGQLRKECLVSIAFFSSSLIGILIFFVLPFIVVIYYAFVNNPVQHQFVGIDNFKNLFGNYSFQLAAKNTAIFSVISVPVAVIGALLLACMLNQKIPLKSQIRSFLLTPMMVPVASIVLIWQVIFSNNGALNAFLSNFGMDKIDWMKSEYNRYVVILLYLWKNLGYNMILFLAALNNVPNDIQEMAMIEGASSFDIATLDGAALYVNNGKVDSSWYSENAKLYVETMKEWHDKGYIYEDILSVTADRNDATDRELNFSGGDYFMFSDQAGHYGDFFTYDLPEGWAVSGGVTPVLNEGDVTHFDVPDMQHNYIVLTTACEDVEVASRFMDWFYTDEGIMTSNYGPEGESWYWSDEGEIIFTDLVWNDPNYGASTAIGFYQTTGRFVSVYEPWLNSLFAGSTVPIVTQEVWASDGDGSMLLPTDYIHLTTEETDVVNEYLSDLQTYVVEQIAAMILGNIDIDANWDNLVETVKSMGLDEIITQYDAAYQRYLAR